MDIFKYYKQLKIVSPLTIKTLDPVFSPITLLRVFNSKNEIVGKVYDRLNTLLKIFIRPFVSHALLPLNREVYVNDQLVGKLTRPFSLNTAPITILNNNGEKCGKIITKTSGIVPKFHIYNYSDEIAVVEADWRAGVMIVKESGRNTPIAVIRRKGVPFAKMMLSIHHEWYYTIEIKDLPRRENTGILLTVIFGIDACVKDLVS